jgi:F1F0 ATPase subunit 2
MTMNDNLTLALALALAAGLGLGAIFFGGLWWTVRKGVSSTRPALWFVGSLLLRTSITLAGFYLVGRGHWEWLLACLLGFVIARVVVTRLTVPPAEQHVSSVKETIHAP